MSAAERWARVASLFDEAVSQPPASRQAFVRSSRESAEVQDEVLSLLSAHDDAGEFLESAALPDLSGSPYRLIRRLGEGGMGVVYQAEDTRLHRQVALKLLSPALARDERQRERLKKEARAAAALTHPGIATIYALEEIDGHLVIVSEYLDGETLRAELQHERMTTARAVAAAIEIARALCAAHDRGVVHRDLKPENIMRTRDGALKVVDFGLAKVVGPDVSTASLTESGMVAGTPPYMAPEQLLGNETDFRTDHFAFGVLLYEMLTARHPFGDGSLPSTIARILAAAPDPPRPQDEIDDATWRIIDRCLQKDRSARYASTRDLLHDLEGVAPAPFAPARAPSHVAPSHLAPLPATALWWWQFHQLAAAVVYWAMAWPIWHVHRAIGSGGLFFFFATLAAIVVAANLRIHLWFSSRVYPDQLRAQRGDTARWIRAADVAFVALLVAAGLMLPEDHAPWAALLISVGIGAAVAFLIIEPATTKAAFD